MHVSVRRVVAAVGAGAAIVALGQVAVPANAVTHRTPVRASAPKASRIHLTKVASGSLLTKPRASARAGRPSIRTAPTRVNRGFGNKASGTTRSKGSSVAARPTVANFDGTSIIDNDIANGFELEPPDQGLCVQPNVDPSTGITDVVYDHVNLAMNLYDTSGALYNGPFPSSFVFQEDPSVFLSDPRCVYDANTGDVFMTALAIAPDGSSSHNDVTVIDSSLNFTVYRYDTSDASSAGCPCFADQPYLGYDRKNIYVGGNEFGISGSAYYGGEIQAIDKYALAAGTIPNAFGYTHLTDSNGVPTVTTQPAQTLTGNGPEYLMDTYVADASGNYIPSSNKYGIFAITHQGNVSLGLPPTLLGPTTVTGPTYTQPLGSPGLGGAVLDGGDDRLQQVELANGKLHTSVGSYDGTNDVGIVLQATPKIVGGVVTATVTGQTVSSPGNDLIYPAVFSTPLGAQAVTGTINSPTLPPSAAYATQGVGATSFSSVATAAAGNGPDLGFTCNTCRWGDYSAATWDPSTHQLWMATEYIPPVTDWGTFANWGTRVFSVRG